MNNLIKTIILILTLIISISVIGMEKKRKPEKKLSKIRHF